VLLTGSVSGGLIRPPRRRIARLAGVGRLKFDLDEQRRWSLWYYGDGPPVPLIQAAVVAARVGDQWITLADLEDSTVGSRRPPGRPDVATDRRCVGEPRRARLDARHPRVSARLRCRRAGRSDRAALAGRIGGRERMAPHPTAPSRRRYVPHADLLSAVR